MTNTRHGRPPGPRRPPGAPVGPEEVRRAVLDAAALLFAERGVDAVSLRDVAAKADVHLALISRYVGNREELVAAVFDHLSERVPRQSWTTPSRDRDSAPTRSWVSGCGSQRHSPSGGGRWRATLTSTQSVAMATTLAEGYGLDELSARVRASQIVAAALGWRIFEDYLLEAGDLHGLPLQDLRDDLAHSARRLGATP